MSENENKNTFTIAKLIPNMVTILAMCCGMFSVRLSIAGDFKQAAYYIIFACCLDAIDGNLARRLNATSDLGAQMDSLADFFDFGVAPGFFVYFWKMQTFDKLRFVAWMPVLLLAICMALRLARFNVALTEDDPHSPLVKYFFTGCPAPMDALLVILPFALETEFGINMCPSFVIANSVIIALFAFSKIPTITPKKMKIKNEYKNLVLLIFVVMLIGLVFKTWLTLSVVMIIYLISIVCGWPLYFKFKREYNKNK